MRKTRYGILIAGLMVLLIACAAAQDKKAVEPPKPALAASQELLWAWNGVGNKLIAMAEDFPEDKYGYKATKEERSFAENLLHVVSDDYSMVSAIKGKAMGPAGSEDSLIYKYPAKADIVKLLKQAIADGAELIKEQGEDGLTREFKYPWGNRMVHASFGWLGTIEHGGEHYGQLVVYYRLNGLVPPASRPRK